ncbi:hypothetical protein Baya_4572 [Bagarius yarrelli]|uniref:Uncharacterized protein n=1 Tax=Bagarius yarrelli TaxID=175774 RepID=A0A556TR72_BAGYA|nr:hypothetical protein Baya_4572 [Bagarius yarrelli]
MLSLLQDAEAVKPGSLSSKVRAHVLHVPVDADGTHSILIIFYIRSETESASQAPSPEDTNAHRQEKSDRPSAPISAEKKPLRAECVPKTPEPLIKVPQYPRPLKCGTDPSTCKAETGEEEYECEEEDEDPDEFRAPIELLAECILGVRSAQADDDGFGFILLLFLSRRSGSELC